MYQSKITKDEQYKFVCQSCGNQILADIMQKEECYDDEGRHYEYLPLAGVSYKSAKVVLKHIDMLNLRPVVKTAFREFVESCLNYGQDMTA